MQGINGRGREWRSGNLATCLMSQHRESYDRYIVIRTKFGKCKDIARLSKKG